jgi:hypothetical protein
MFTDILNHIDTEIQDLNSQIRELSEKRQGREKARTSILLLQAEEDQKAGKLATQKGICPFPEACSKANYCTADRCNADTCSNGYAYRMS